MEDKPLYLTELGKSELQQLVLETIDDKGKTDFETLANETTFNGRTPSEYEKLEKQLEIEIDKLVRDDVITQEGENYIPGEKFESLYSVEFPKEK